MFTDFDSINVGDYRQIRKEITLNDVERFVALTGDDNPLHVDAAFASKRHLRILWCMECSVRLLFQLLSVLSFGPGALWISQDQFSSSGSFGR